MNAKIQSPTWPQRSRPGGGGWDETGALSPYQVQTVQTSPMGNSSKRCADGPGIPGRTPRSNPAVYVGAFEYIATLRQSGGQST